jgi:LacI family transcriptional regulator
MENLLASKRWPGVTAADVGRRAGTSSAVVSYVMNEGPRPVAAETRERVLRVARELGYRPHRLASSLRSGRSGFIGLVVPNTDNPYFSALARSIERAADGAGLLTFIANASLSDARERASVNAFLEARVDGLIVIDVGEATKSGSFDTAPVPLIWVHHRPDGAPGPLISFDSYSAGRQATEHLLEHGHRRVDCLTGPVDAGPVTDRLRGWRDALTEAGIRPDPSWVLRSGYDRESAQRTVRAALTAQNIEALVAFTDTHALGAVRGAADLNRHMPDDLALTTCDGTADTEYSVPSLTAVTKPIGALAKHVIAALQADPVAGVGDEVIGPLTLERRQSCGCT